MNFLRGPEGGLQKNLAVLGVVGALALAHPANPGNTTPAEQHPSVSAEAQKNVTLKRIAERISKVILCVKSPPAHIEAYSSGWRPAVEVDFIDAPASTVFSAVVGGSDGQPTASKTEAIQIVDIPRNQILKIALTDTAPGSHEWVSIQHPIRKLPLGLLTNSNPLNVRDQSTRTSPERQVQIAETAWDTTNAALARAKDSGLTNPSC